MIAVVALVILPVLWRIPETAPRAGWTAVPQPI
jgi:MHS family proline/betaine transporter-like MFS transporter